MAEQTYLLDPETLDPVSLYDPRYRRRRHRTSYDPRRKRRSRARRRSYDPQRRMLSRLRPGRRSKSIGARLNKSIGKLGFGLGIAALLGSATWADYQRAKAAIAANPTTNNFSFRAKYWFADLVWRVSLGTVDLFPSIPWFPAAQQSGVIAPGGFQVLKGLNTPFWAGLALTIYGLLPFRLPYKSAAKKIGIPIAVGSYIGGSVDPSPSTTPSTLTYHPPSTTTLPMAAPLLPGTAGTIGGQYGPGRAGLTA